MPVNSDFKLIKEKILDEGITLKISQNIMSGRIFVEFTCDNPKIVLQKNFQNSLDGKTKSQEFAKSIKTVKDLKKYFRLEK